MNRPFTLSTGPLLRVKLLRLSDCEHIVVVTMHHIISDGWSMNNLIEEMAALYVAYSGGHPIAAASARDSISRLHPLAT